MIVKGRVCRYRTDGEHQWHWWHWFLAHAPTDVTVQIGAALGDPDREEAVIRGWPLHHVAATSTITTIPSPDPWIRERLTKGRNK